MEKNNKSLGCSKCYEAERDYDNIHTENSYKVTKTENDEFRTIDIIKHVNCLCMECGNKYTVDYKSRYTLYSSDEFEDQAHNVKLMAKYESEEDRDYKLIALYPTLCDNCHDEKFTKKPVYLMLYEDDEYPIMISEATALEIINEYNELYEEDVAVMANKLAAEPKEDKRIIYNTWMDRYR